MVLPTGLTTPGGEVVPNEEQSYNRIPESHSIQCSDCGIGTSDAEPFILQHGL